VSTVTEVILIIAVFFVIGVGVGIAVVYGLSARRADRDRYAGDDDGDDARRPPGGGWSF
jgi:hypothetical protein